MTFKAVPMDQIQAARNRHTFSPEQIAEAITILQAGEAVQSEQTYPNVSQARRAALVLRERIKKEGILTRTTVVHDEEEDIYSYQLVLSE